MESRDNVNNMLRKDSEHSLVIYQLNCNSIINKLSEFKLYLYSNKPDIFCVCETMLKNNREPKFIGYNTVWKHRVGDGGGLGILIREDVLYQEVVCEDYRDGGLEIQIVEVHCKIGKIRIGNVYNPHKTIYVPEFNYYLNVLGQYGVMIGDFNAHSPLWDQRGRSNTTGRNIEHILESSNIGILNDNIPTYFDNRTGTTSCLDLCLATLNLIGRGDINRGRDIGSDHFPIECMFGICAIKNSTGLTRRWKIKEADWKKWNKDLTEYEISEGSLYPADVSELNNILTKKIINVSNKHIPKTTVSKRYRRGTIWWDKECNQAIKNRNLARNRLMTHPTPENKIIYKRNEAIVKHTIKKKKKQSWQNFASTLNSNTPSSKVWRIIKNINGKRSSQNTPIGEYVTNEEKADQLMNFFMRRMGNTDEEINVTNAVANASPIIAFPEITLYEVERCLKTLKNTSPGGDDICNEFLKRVPTNIKEELVYLFNTSLTTSTIPAEWKHAIICPIPKPGKDPSLISSYRPISMLSCVGKLMERIMQNRLEFFLESNSIFTANQAGFRRCRGTYDILATLKNIICNTFEKKEYCVAVYLDLEGAYDTVWHSGLSYKLETAGIPLYITKWIKEYLHNRTVSVRVSNHLSEKTVMKTGLPQGAVLSPILFNVMLYDMPKSEHVKILSYADDITIVSCGSNLVTVQENLQEYIDILLNWLNTWKLTINPSKCSLQVFTKKRNADINLHINNQDIAHNRVQRLLGILLDAPKLTMRDHISYLRNEGSKRMCVLRAISSSKWGASRNLLRRVYISYIRSKLEYGCLLFDLTPSLMNRLNVVQNNALRIILGARKTSPILSLEAEAYVVPIKMRFDFLFMKWYSKMQYSPGNDQVPEIADEVGLSEMENSFFRAKASEMFAKLDMLPIKRVKTSYISPIDPTCVISKYINCDMFTDEKLIRTNRTMNHQFNNFYETTYSNAIQVYTDGSKLDDGSTSAALYIPHTNRITAWKLNPTHSILGAELYAIFKAIQYVISQQWIKERKTVIMTDSKSSLLLLGNAKNPSHKHIVFKIQELLVKNENKIILQWVRSHSGIEGNEIADSAARLGHQNNFSALDDLNYDEVLATLKRKFFKLWVKEWKENVALSGKGTFYSNHTDEPKYRLWLGKKDRICEIVSARFRIGHVGVLGHMNRFEMVESPECQYCYEPETVNHFLMECYEFFEQRLHMINKLSEINVEFNLRNILLGGDFDERKQCKIHNIFIAFIRATGRMYDM